MIATTDTREVVENWLRALGCTPVAENDAGSGWHLHFDYPVKTPNLMHVVSPAENRDAVVIATGITVNGAHVETFGRLSDDEKVDFLYEFRQMLNTPETDFIFEGTTGALDIPKTIQISSLRYTDGLTLDSFARSTGAVYKMQLKTMMFVQHKLGERPGGPLGRFDFKRL